jgi:hypothetical protein
VIGACRPQAEPAGYLLSADVLIVYFSALDHYAHDEGLEGYVDFFKNTTDSQIRNVVKALKDEDEFDNKIFLITARPRAYGDADGFEV